MPPIIFVALQGLFLVLLYLFVARAVRAVWRDVSRSAATARPARAAPPPRPAPTRQPAGRAAAAAPTRGARRPAGELVVHLPDARPRVVKLDGGEVRFGRSDSSTIQLKDSYVSELHARVYRSGEQWVVADMGSTNGTFLNRAKVTSPTPIHPGDQLGIGKTVVEVRR